MPYYFNKLMAENNNLTAFNYAHRYKADSQTQYTFSERTESSNSLISSLVDHLPADLQENGLKTIKKVVDVGIGSAPHPTYFSLKENLGKKSITVNGVEIDEKVNAEDVIHGNILNISGNKNLRELIEQADVVSIRNLVQFHFNSTEMQTVLKELQANLKEGAIVLITERRRSPNERGFIYQQINGQLIMKKIVFDYSFIQGIRGNDFCMSTGKENKGSNTPIIDIEYFINSLSIDSKQVKLLNQYHAEYNKISKQIEDLPTPQTRRRTWKAWWHCKLKDKLIMFINRNSTLWYLTDFHPDTFASLNNYKQELQNKRFKLEINLKECKKKINENIIKKQLPNSSWPLELLGQMFSTNIPQNYTNSSANEIYIPSFFDPKSYNFDENRQRH